MARKAQDNYKQLKLKKNLKDRPDQERLLGAIDELIHAKDPTTLLAEAPTGVGKTVAYLVPGLTALANREINQVIVATGKNPLSDQIVKRDLPDTITGLGLRNLKIKQVKGFANYVCGEKVKDPIVMNQAKAAEAEAKNERGAEALESLAAAVDTKGQAMALEFGDVAHELARETKKLCGCEGEGKCPYPEAGCQYKVHMASLPTADVIVTNQHYLASFGGTLQHLKGQDDEAAPQKVLIVIDEAHNLPGIVDRMRSGKFNLSLLAAGAEELLTLTGDPRLPDRLKPDSRGWGAALRRLRIFSAAIHEMERRIGEDNTETLTNVLEADTGTGVSGAILSANASGEGLAEHLKDFSATEISGSILANLYGAIPALERQREVAESYAAPLRAKIGESGAQSLTREEASELDLLTAIEGAAGHFVRVGQRYPKEKAMGDDPLKWRHKDVQKVLWLDRSTSELYMRYGTAIGPFAERGYYSDSLAGVFQDNHQVVLLSATMSTDARREDLSAMFRKFRQRGRQEMTFFAKPSFDFATNARILAVSDPAFADMGRTPHDPAAKAANRSRIVDVVADTAPAADGNTLVLYTNFKEMAEAGKLLRRRLKERGMKGALDVLIQGEEHPTVLLDRMRRTPVDGVKRVLFGVDTMWEGVDLPGAALRSVVITKVPFGNPSDPLESARKDLWGKAAKIVRGTVNPATGRKRRGPSYFEEKYLPEALMKLRQGLGRLLRNEQDYGTILITDPRFSMVKPDGSFARAYMNRVCTAFPSGVELIPAGEAGERVKAFFEHKAPPKGERPKAAPKPVARPKSAALPQPKAPAPPVLTADWEDDDLVCGL